MLTTTVNLPTRRTPSPQIRARDTSLDGTTNGSAGVNSAPDVDAGVNGATHLSGQRCRDHEYRGDNTNYRKLAEHNLSLPWAQITELPLGRVYQLVRVSEDDLILEPFTGQLPPWQRRTNAWRKPTSPARGPKRLISGQAIPAARRNFVHRQRQGPLRVSAAGLLNDYWYVGSPPSSDVPAGPLRPWSEAPPGSPHYPGI